MVWISKTFKETVRARKSSCWFNFIFYNLVSGLCFVPLAYERENNAQKTDPDTLQIEKPFILRERTVTSFTRTEVSGLQT